MHLAIFLLLFGALRVESVDDGRWTMELSRCCCDIIIKTLLKHHGQEFELIFAVLNDHNEFYLIIFCPTTINNTFLPFILAQVRRKKQFPTHKKSIVGSRHDEAY